MLSGSSSTRSSRIEENGSQSTRSYDGYLADNLLDDENDQYSPTGRAMRGFSGLSLSSSQIGHDNAESFRLVLAVDYGTTFTGVAFATTQSDTAQLGQIQLMQDWGPKMGNHWKIPSVYSYSPAPNGEQQWGTNISRNAITMRDMKPELEVQDKRLDELELTLQVLEGTGNLSFNVVKRSGGYPEYTWKSPAEIITDYLTKVFEYVYRAADLGNPVRSRHPVDIVITVPAKWSYEATNATLGAFRAAGFNDDTFETLNDVILITEPEAAAIFAARYLKEQKRTEFLKLGEHFILCDAGGGTVDVISYQVTQLEPQLELTRVTLPTSDKCGASYIDGNFKRWLYRAIGDRNYQALDPKSKGQRIGAHTTESGEMRELLKRFDVEKQKFSNSSQVVKLDLPKPLDKLTIPGRVREGEILIHPEDMKTMFNPCVNRVVELVKGQIQQIERKNKRRVKNLFLVGGFGESPYLQEELNEALRIRKISMRRLERKRSWTAVVQGAVIYGIEKNRHQNVRLMRTSPKSYGIVINEPFSGSRFNQQDRYMDSLTNTAMARKQIAWLVRKGDLILSAEKKVSKKEFSLAFRMEDTRIFELPIYVYPDDDDDVPSRWETGQHEILKIGAVSCDIFTNLTDKLEQRKNYSTGQKYYIAHLVCKMQLSLSSLEVDVFVDSVSIGHTQVNIGGGTDSRDSLDLMDPY